MEILRLTLISGLLLGLGFNVADSQAASDDPCYGVAIEIQTENTSTIQNQKQGYVGAKALAADIRKHHRLASVPPVTLINDRPSEIPTIVLRRPTDFRCALAITEAIRRHAGVSTEPQLTSPSERTSVGIIHIWWPADSPSFIAKLNRSY